MSSPVKPDHWREVLGDMPYPDGATAEMMWAARDALDDLEGIDDALENISVFEDIKQRWKFRHSMAVNGRHMSPENEKEFQHVQYVMDSLDTIIGLYKEKIHGR